MAHISKAMEKLNREYSQGRQADHPSCFRRPTGGPPTSEGYRLNPAINLPDNGF